MPRPVPTWRPRPLRAAATDALLASTLSAAALLWRGRVENRSASSALNAIAHWFWPREALRQDGPSARYTGVGAVLHYGSSLLWAGLYGWLRTMRRDPTPTNALCDAAAVTAMAAVVDLELVPDRLSPGFQERLSGQGLTWVYLGFGAGLALGGLLALRRR